MKVSKSTMKTECTHTEDGKIRIGLRKEWNRNKARSVVIMKSPSEANELILDHTTMHVINNLVRLDFGSVDIVNLYPHVGAVSMKDLGKNKDLLLENDKHIAKVVEKADIVVLAWGMGCESSKKIKKRIEDVKLLLKDSDVVQIHSTSGRSGYHPLASDVRNHWILK